MSQDHCQTPFQPLYGSHYRVYSLQCAVFTGSHNKNTKIVLMNRIKNNDNSKNEVLNMVSNVSLSKIC